MLLFAPKPQKNITTSGSKWIFKSKFRVSHNLCHRGNSYSNISFKDPNAISVIHLGTILDEGIVKEVAVETDLTTGGVGGVHGVRVPAKPQSTRGKSSANNIFFHNKAAVACCYQQYIQHIPIYHIPQMLTSLSLMVKPHYQMPHVLRKSSTECDWAHHDMWTGLAHQQKEAFQEGHLSTTPWKGVKPTASNGWSQRLQQPWRNLRILRNSMGQHDLK